MSSGQQIQVASLVISEPPRVNQDCTSHVNYCKPMAGNGSELGMEIS